MRIHVVRPIAVLGVLGVLALGLGLAGCPGGKYAEQDRSTGGADRGETNGRMFDLVSNKPDNDDWQIRVRDDSLTASYGNGEDVKQYGPTRLAPKEARKLWKLIDELDIGGRKKGKKDEDDGYLQLRLREPGGEDEEFELTTIYVSRATEDDDILALGAYLQELLKKYHRADVEL